MDLKEVEMYVDTVIPKLERELVEETGKKKLLELYNLYEDILILVAPYDFISYNKALEFHEDKTDLTKGFYHHRKNHIGDIFQAMNDMEIYNKYDMLLVSMPPRVGKALPNYEKVLTPNGWTTMDKIEIGDEVIGYNGQPTKVNGVFPQGKRDTYKVTFDDNTSVDCDLDHLWTVKTRDDRNRGGERTITTKEMMGNLYLENGSRKNYSIDYVRPVEFKDYLTKDDIHPYILGALLGDGGLVDSVRLTNEDPELINRVRELLPVEDSLNHYCGIQYGIAKKDITLRTKKGQGRKSHTHTKLNEYGLFGKKSETKFIPNNYLYASVENRLELLRGIMDSDGHCNTHGNSSYNEYTTVSPYLAQGVMELIQSLGGRVTMNSKTGSYVKNGMKHKCQLYYRLSFNMILNPFFISRKASVFKPRKKRPYKYITSIEKVGDNECTCISVDCEKNLFVTNGYNLTHNTTSNIRFQTWICGRYPEQTQLATSYSSAVTNSFYAGFMEIVTSEQYNKIFPQSPLMNQNAKRNEVWLKTIKRYPSIAFISIGASMTGVGEASKYLFCDDLISGIEEALSITRMEKLWQLYTVNARQRKKDGAKEIHISTRWTVNGVITKLSEEHKNDPRCKIINVPALDKNGESNFNFKGGFSTKYYENMKDTMDEMSFNALYMGDPIEREGLLYSEDELQYFYDLPSDNPDTVVSVCDSKALGKDNVASPVGHIYGDTVYIEDVIYDDGLPEITVPRVAGLWYNQKVVRGDVEMNAGGNFFADRINEEIKELGGHTSIRMFFTSQNKRTKIITYSDYIKKHFVFKHPSQYSPNSDYARFMNDLFRWTQKGSSNQVDDAPDSLAMLAQLVQELDDNIIKIMDRQQLRL